MEEKGFVSTETITRKVVQLGKNGILFLRKGLPERRLVEALKNVGGVSDIFQLKKILGMDDVEFNAALGISKRKGWVSIEGSRVLLQGNIPTESDEERLLRMLSKTPLELENIPHDLRGGLERILSRPGIVMVTEKKEKLVKLLRKPEKIELEEGEMFVTPDIIRNIAEYRQRYREKGKERIKFTKLDVVSPVSLQHIGRLHPITRLIEEIREILISMGFQEIEGNLVQPSFWVFDALFTPQDHPAREMQDTLYIKGVTSKPQDKELTKKIKSVHENGWKTGSAGWNYVWSEAESLRSVLRTHTTALSSRYLFENPMKESRVFSIGRVFRNENLDSRHLFEFTQIEAVISESNATATTLLGYMTEFYKALGFDDVKFYPTYFPYTEPSFEPNVYSKELGGWIELGGSGVFRPEVVKPLGIKNNVLAWGFGLERIAMARLGLKDIRSIYSNNLGFLRGVLEYP